MRVPRLKDVAERAGVSTATSSRVLTGNGSVSEGLRRRVLQAVEELNYTTDGVARSMSRGQTHTFGLVVPDITNPFYTTVARGVEDRAHEEGYSLVLCNTDESVSEELAYLRVLQEKRVDGVILAVSGENCRGLEPFIEAGMKIVLIDRTVPALQLPSVCVDNVGGARRATDYLLGLGHTEIGIVTGKLSITTARERLSGYLEALKLAGIDSAPSLIASGNFTEVGGRAAASQLCQRSNPPTAILSSNNLMTTGLLHALRGLGLRVRDDISIVTFDDLTYFDLLDRPLTVVAQPMYDLGRTACELLLQIGPPGGVSAATTHIQLPTQFIIRDSCRSVSVGVG